MNRTPGTVAAIFLAGTLLLSSGASARQVAGAGGASLHPTDAIQAILDAFDTYPVVALGEGMHANWQSADFRLSLLRDPRFPEKVDDILVEFGTERYQGIMDRYTAGLSVPRDSLRLCWRETTQPVLWDHPIYQEFFAAVRALNQTLPEGRRLRVLLGDPSPDWSRITTRQQLEAWYEKNRRERPWGWVNARDGSAVDVLLRESYSKGRRALVIYGDSHFSRVPLPVMGFWSTYFEGTLVDQMERLHPGSILSVTTIISPQEIEDAIPEAATWPRASFLRLEGTAAAAIVKDRYTTLGKAFDALVWLGPTGTISYSKLPPEVVADEAYYREALRRDALWMNQFQEELHALRQRGRN